MKNASSIIKYELYKTVMKRTFIFILFIFLFSNLILLYTSSQQDKVKPYGYKKLQQELREMDDGEKEKFLTSLFNEFQITYRIHILALEGISNNTDSINWLREEAKNFGISDKKFDELWNTYFSGNHLKYTEDINDEMALLDFAYKEMKDVAEYSSFLKELKRQAEENAEISIFQTEDNIFSIRNIKKTAIAFEPLNQLTLHYSSSKGILKAINFTATDVCVVLFLFFVCMFLILQEKSTGLLLLIRPMKYGKGQLVISKLIVLILICFISTVLFWGGNLLLCHQLFGSCELGNPLPSLFGYSGSNLNITIGGYLVLFVLTKFIVYMIIGILLFYFALKAKHPLYYYIKTLAFFGVSFFLYMVIGKESVFQLLKYINIIPLMKVTPIYQFYFNLNIFNHPVNLITCSHLALGITLPAITLIVIRNFCNYVNGDFVKLKLPKLFRRKPKVHVSIFYHETYKTLIGQKALAILLIMLSLQCYIVFQDKETISYTGYYYKKYMDVLNGEVTQEKLDIIKKEQARIDEVYKKLADLSERFSNGEISKNVFDSLKQTLENQIKFEDALKLVQERLTYINQYKEKNNKDLWFVFEKGWYELLASTNDGYSRDIQNGLLLVLSLIASLCAVFSTEYSSDMIKIISVYKKGRKHTYKTKVTLSIIIATILFLIIYIPDLVHITQIYGLPELTAPSASLPALENSILPGTLLTHILILYLVRYLTVIAITMLILWISTKSKNMLLCIVYSLLILAVPLVLHLLGITFLDYVSMNSFLSGNMLLNPKTSSALVKSIALAAGPIIPIIMSVIFYYRNRKNYV